KMREKKRTPPPPRHYDGNENDFTIFPPPGFAMSGRMFRHQRVEALGVFSHRRQVSLPDRVFQSLNLLTNFSQCGLAQNIASIPHQLFRMTNEEPGMFDGARPKHAAKATRSGPFAKSRFGTVDCKHSYSMRFLQR